ncbi:Uncharacterised protein [Janthinobacterium lividum]|nr:hypothetical protein JANLI_55330 [Janthinobacterium lividum]STS86223.1 Uncharacterised protein [Janthinobacterium lividum]
MHPDSASAARMDTRASRHGATALLDWLLAYMGLRNDACLARELGVPPFTIGKLRSGHAEIDADMLIRMHEASGLAIGELRAGMGDQRRRFHR